MNPVQFKTTKKISILRLEYESYLGSKICDRTWKRLRDRLSLNDENDLDELSVVRGAALLRSFNRSAKVTYSSARQYGLIVDHFYPEGCSRIYGKDVAIAIQNCFRSKRNRPPRRETLWKWGLRMSETYSLNEVKDFLKRAYLAGFIVSQSPPQVQQTYLAA